VDIVGVHTWNGAPVAEVPGEPLPPSEPPAPEPDPEPEPEPVPSPPPPPLRAPRVISRLV
jgi:hypothetical protein